MSPEQIRRWRPTLSRDFVGEKNRRVIARINRKLRNGTLPTPLLLVSPFGYGKTSLSRRSMLSLNCEQRDPVQGDPCLVCDQCRCSGSAYQGTGFPYKRIEVDCTQAGRPEIIALCEENRDRDDVVLFLDELHHLHERNSQEALLKFIEDFPGLIIAAVMSDRYPELIPPLRERFETAWLEPPNEDEMVSLVARKCGEDWGILASQPVIRDMIRASGLSFRICLKILAAAAERDPRRLDMSLVEDFLAPGDQGRHEIPASPAAGEAHTAGEEVEVDNLFSG